ncbi:MAG: hypothetical protein IJZ85_08935 [Lachnospiraceae bacterium]|nr:hypothetical protein [Lachnospiraceae bacterium]
MILDNYWKLELRVIICALRIWKIVPLVSWFELLQHQVNKCILYSTIIVRKIIEDEKWAKDVCDNSNGTPMPEFPILNAEINVYEYHFVGDKDWIGPKVVVDNYDVNNNKKIQFKLEHACNNIIHSYLWSLVFSEKHKKVKGFVTASDRFKDKYMYLVSIDEWLKALEYCIENANI